MYSTITKHCSEFRGETWQHLRSKQFYHKAKLQVVQEGGNCLLEKFNVKCRPNKSCELAQKTMYSEAGLQMHVYNFSAD